MLPEVRSTEIQERLFGTAGDKNSCYVMGLSDQA